MLKPPSVSFLPLTRRAFARFAVVLALGAACFPTLAARAQSTDIGGGTFPPVPEPTVSYSRLVVFGDSLSDTGNFAATTEDNFSLRFPGDDFNYADGRFTSGTSTNPANKFYKGIWHEQLCQLFLGIPAANASLDGGTDYAYGSATSGEGQTPVEIINGVNINVDNLNRQVSNYLGSNAPDPAALYVVWAGANDLFNADAASGSTQESDNNAAIAAANNVALVVERLARAGAVNFLVNNLPPIGATPEFNTRTDASARLTNASLAFRDQLNANLDGIGARLLADGIAVDIRRLDIYELFSRLTASNGQAYGLANITQSAQDANVKADQYLFWDNVHPTTAGHFQIAAEAYTILTGTPVVQLNGQTSRVNRNAGLPGVFYLTRTGPDLSTKLKVNYRVGGAAIPGQDYNALSGNKKIKVGQRTATISVFPTAAPAGTVSRDLKLNLIADPLYALPAVLKAKLKFDAQ